MLDSLDGFSIDGLYKLAPDEEACLQRHSTLVNGRVKLVSERLGHVGSIYQATALIPHEFLYVSLSVEPHRAHQWLFCTTCQTL